MVATAFEEPTLFSMSARENVTLGRPDASDEDIHAAIETAQAGFVYDLPWGLDTRIGEQGMSLSGGQRQRLALARAVLARPRILVLDDTLSALDVHTEALVEKALRRVLAEATGIVVAHRASTVMLADKVALLQDGTITHVGRTRAAARRGPGVPRPARRRCRRGRSRVRAGSGGAAMTPHEQRGYDVVDESTEDMAEEVALGADDWRGVAAEDRDEIPDKVSLVLQDRSRRLLKQLLRPHKKLLVLLMIAVVIENAARLSVPFLVKHGIDNGIPPIVAGNGSQHPARDRRASCWWRW